MQFYLLGSLTTWLIDESTGTGFVTGLSLILQVRLVFVRKKLSQNKRSSDRRIFLNKNLRCTTITVTNLRSLVGSKGRFNKHSSQAWDFRTIYDPNYVYIIIV